MTPVRRFAAGAVIALVPLLALWWGSADAITAALRPVVGIAAQILMPITAVRGDGQGGWRVETNLLVTDSKAGGNLEVATFNVDHQMVRRLSLSWPLLLALLLAPPRANPLAPRLAAALAILAALFVAGGLAEIFGYLAALVNHVPGFGNELMPTVRVAAPPYSDVTFFAGKLGRYAALYFQPLAAPPVLWLALNPRAGRLFLVVSAARNPQPSEP